MNKNDHLISQCLDIAEKAHAGQTDKAKAPYILHPMVVSELVKAHDRTVLKRLGKTFNEEQYIEARCVALLHDVLEDSTVTVDDLRDQYHLPSSICDAVKVLTKTKGEDYGLYLQRVKANPISRLVKLADLLDNANLKRLKRITEEDRKRRLKYLKAMKYLWQD